MAIKKNFTTFYDWCITHNKEQYLREWHYDLNVGKSPSDLSYGSEQSVWWQCSLGHPPWPASPNRRTYKGSGCPYCSGRKPIPGENDLATVRPDLLLEWFFEKNDLLGIFPTDVKEHSNKEVWWRCSVCGNVYKSYINNRSKGVGCPICAKKRQISFPEKACFFYVQKIFPTALENFKNKELIGNLEFDIYIPHLRCAIEIDGPHHKVKKDLKKNEICQNLGIRIIRLRYPELPVLNDGISKDIILSSESVPDLCIGISLVCDFLIEEYKKPKRAFQVDVAQDRLSIQVFLRKYHIANCLQTRFPEIASEWVYEMNAGISPMNVGTYVDDEYFWRCKDCGYVWKASVYSRVHTKQGRCPVCFPNVDGSRLDAEAKEKIAKALKTPKDGQSLGDLYPDLLLEWNFDLNNASPFDVKPGSGDPAAWTCSKCGHNWEAVISSRVRGNGCPICGRGKISKARKMPKEGQSLADLRPDLSSEWCFEKNDSSPYDYKLGSSDVVYWKCSNCNHIWPASISNRTKSNGTGCPECWKQRKNNTLHRQKVAVFENGCLIGEFSSYGECAEFVGCSRAQVCNCCNGKSKGYKNFTFKKIC